jgi:hypothetical protein
MGNPSEKDVPLVAIADGKYTDAEMYPMRPPWPKTSEIIRYLRKTIEVADHAMEEGKHPFGCILVDGKGGIVYEQGNCDTLNHAELTLCRKACKLLPPFLRNILSFV